jgi:hypothetical protein
MPPSLVTVAQRRAELILDGIAWRNAYGLLRNGVCLTLARSSLGAAPTCP